MRDAGQVRPTFAAPSRRSGLVAFLVRMWTGKPLGAAGAIIVLLLTVVAIFADVLSPYPYDEVHMIDRLQGSSAKYWLGTDQVGRDFLSRVIYGARISLVVGLTATVVNIVVSFFIGGVSGFVGGKTDLVTQRFVDAWIAFPGLLLLLTILTIVGKGVPQIILVLGISGGIGGSRIIRGAVIGIKENDYFLAARHTQLGRSAKQGGPAIHGARPALGPMAWPLPNHCRLQPEHVRRRAQRPPRSADENPFGEEQLGW